MNLRLTDETAAAVRAAAQQRGLSQQELIREAISAYLGLAESRPSDRERLVLSGLVLAPSPFRDIEPSIVLPTETSSDLLDRDDRI